MTAQRWWVRMGARWLARIDGVNEQLRLFFLAMTGYGIVSGTLIDIGYGNLVLPFLGVNAVLLAGYTYLYNEYGVRNQVGRDRQDLSNNFSDPDKLINYLIIARQSAMIAHELQRDEPRPYDEIVADMQDESREEWENLRNGVDLGALDD